MFQSKHSSNLGQREYTLIFRFQSKHSSNLGWRE
jgi:hypothetical protein